MLRAQVEVVRCDWSAPGQAVRFVCLDEGARRRLAAFLLKRGGLSMLPQLDRRHPVITRHATAGHS